MRRGVEDWTSEETDRLRLCYRNDTPLREFAELFPGRSIEAVLSKANRLGLTRQTCDNGWSDHELETLARLYPRRGWLEIFRKLPRKGKKSIMVKAHQLGIIRFYRLERSWPGMVGGIDAYGMTQKEWREHPSEHHKRMCEKYKKPDVSIRPTNSLAPLFREGD